MGGLGHERMVGCEWDEILGWIEGALGKPVIDRTGLAGRFDLELTWDPSQPAGYRAALLCATGVEVAVERQVMDVLVVETTRPCEP